MEVGRNETTKKVMLALAFHALKEFRIVMPLFEVIAKYRAGTAFFEHPPPLHTEPSKGNRLFKLQDVSLGAISPSKNKSSGYIF